jgi:hypothetical protein
MTDGHEITELAAENLAGALAVLQTRLPKIDKASKAQYGSYADLADVSRQLLPVMGALGLSFSAKPTWVTRENGDREFVLAYRLRHISGEEDSGEYPLGTSLANHQALGSAITYGRRYCLCAITGAVADADDDGQAASQPAAARRQRQPPRPVEELPRNADGTISRSQTTDEEKLAAGIMTKEQQAEHNKLERDVKGTDSHDKVRNPQGEHVTETPADDPWYDTPPSAVRAPRPAGNITGIIHREFGRLGFTDEQRPARLKVMSTITGRDITSTNDLNAGEALEVKRLISACKDQGVLAEKLLQRQKEATGG